MNHELFLHCLKAAQQIVEAYRLPDGMEFYAFDVGGSDTSGNSRFQRSGTSTVQKDFTLPSDLDAIIRMLYGMGSPTQTTSTNEQARLNEILTQSLTTIPGFAALQEMMNIDPVNFESRGALDTMAQRNPYSGDYETAIGDLYDRQFAKGRSLAMSGPTNVRGGTARQGFELGELSANVGREKFREVRAQQDKEAGVVSEAVKTMQTIESMRRGSKLGAQGQNVAGELGRQHASLGAAGAVNDLRRTNSGAIALASDMLGRPSQTTTDNLRGRGAQSTQSNNWGVGLTCCFIFLQALNGELPPFVRKGREEFNTENRRAGYVWMSSWLVPLMRRFWLVSRFVDFVMIKPFLITGSWYYLGQYRIVGPALKPWCWAWFWVWSMIGWSYAKRRLLRQAAVSAV